MDALLFVTHVINPDVLFRFRRLDMAFAEYGNAFLLVEENDSTREFLSASTLNEKVIPFNWKSLISMGVTPLCSTITPGSNHFVTLLFFLSNPEYKNYWSIEFDVDFLGDWKYFFNKACFIEADFISCHIQHYSQNPSWFWWNSYHNGSALSKFDIPIALRFKSFNPIYKIAGRSLYFLFDALINGVRGHHEVVIPTLLFHNGFKIADFGDCNQENVLGNIEPLYLKSSKFSFFGSMQHVSFTRIDCFLKWKNVLVHPIK